MRTQLISKKLAKKHDEALDLKLKHLNELSEELQKRINRCKKHIKDHFEKHSDNEADAVEDLEYIYRQLDKKDESHEVFEAYTIGIIADLDGYIQGQTQKAYLLQRVKDRFPIDRRKVLNLWLQLVLAKQQSNISWEFKDTFTEMKMTLDAIDNLIIHCAKQSKNYVVNSPHLVKEFYVINIKRIVRECWR